MKTLYTMILCVTLAVIAGCATTAVKPVPDVVTKPVVMHETTVRYVAIDAGLTAQVPDPGTAVVPGVTPWGAVLAGDLGCGAALGVANARLGAIAKVQGTDASTGPPTQPH